MRDLSKRNFYLNNIGERYWFFAFFFFMSVTTEKDFGVHDSTKLFWNNRIGVIISKANKMLGMIKRTCTSVCDRKLS